ncbi:TPA: ead/Ea22-like family protein [Enterobacter hormaechei]|nr:ead/Ea22-like family protein [Enterobacter hormaechei]
MSNIDKLGLRLTAEKAKDNFMPNFMVPTRDVLALLDELEAKEKRIAELEAQEVREEGNQFLVVRHPGRSPVIKHSAGDLEGFLRQLLEHDPMATIDIITHRYYGVGGQWVQDADEYLQMMAAAAGKGEA